MATDLPTRPVGLAGAGLVALVVLLALLVLFGSAAVLFRPRRRVLDVELARINCRLAAGPFALSPPVR